MTMENQIHALDDVVKRHETVIEAMRTKLDDIRAIVGRVEAQLINHREPGTTEFCKQHVAAVNSFCQRIHEIEDVVNHLDKDLAGFKVRVATWVAVVVVIVNFAAPILLKKMGVI